MSLLDSARHIEELDEEYRYRKLSTETAYKSLQDARDQFRADMEKLGTKSFKSTDGRFQASIKQVTKYEYDPKRSGDTIEWIELNTPDPYVYLNVNRVAFKNILTEALQKSVSIPGVAVILDETLAFSIKKDKEE